MAWSHAKLSNLYEKIKVNIVTVLPLVKFNMGKKNMKYMCMKRTDKDHIKIDEEIWEGQLALLQYIWVWMLNGNNWIFGVEESKEEKCFQYLP